MATISARTVIARSARRFSSSVSSGSGSSHSHRNNHQQTHNFLEPNSFIGSWEAPRNPKEAQAKLAGLRRDYANQVKELRKDYMVETESLRLEKQRKEEARIEAIRAANEERKKLKAEAAKAKALERKIAEEEFRRTLLKERAEKLELWRTRELMREEKKKESKELLCRQSSMWIDEQELGKKILEAIVDSTPL
uniref:DNA ligase 1 n=1 Tax=Rhizophora mucronata TaxID=61149 RepID=A0A2P2NG21_RHIMU